MKYKVGDKVRVKENLPLYMKAHCVSTFSPETLEYNGMIVTVSEVKKDQYKIDEDNGFYDWYEDMLEPVEEMSAEEAIKVLGEICCENKCFGGCPISKAKGKMPCQNFRRDKAEEVIEILKQWKADHEKKEVEVEFACTVLVIEDTGDVKKCVYEEDIPYSEDWEEAQVRVLKEYCKDHNGKFFAVMDSICRVKE